VEPCADPPRVRAAPRVLPLAVHGNVLEAFHEGRLEVGEHTLFEPGVWITAPGTARIRIGSARS
jgi:hypothetical protein